MTKAGKKTRTTTKLRPVTIHTSMNDLNDKQRKWLAHYVVHWNKTEASRQAGYNASSDSALSKIGFENSQKLSLLIQPYLEQKVEEMNEELKAEEKGSVMTLKEIFVFWSEIINDSEQDIKDRLRASEMLAKAQGGFIERVQFENVENQNRAFSSMSIEELRKLAEIETPKSLS